LSAVKVPLSGYNIKAGEEQDVQKCAWRTPRADALYWEDQDVWPVCHPTTLQGGEQMPDEVLLILLFVGLIGVLELLMAWLIFC